MNETESKIRMEIDELEDRRYRAMETGDLGELDVLFGPELVYIHSSAVLDSKEEYMTSLRSGEIRYERFERSNVRVEIFGESTAALSGQIKIWLDIHGIRKELNNLFTALWVRKANGVWHFVSWQSTPIPKA
jgi:hypothetical protein